MMRNISNDAVLVRVGAFSKLDTNRFLTRAPVCRSTFRHFVRPVKYYDRHYLENGTR